jgi:DNA-binding beta-propeller fold protein YncE
MVLRNSHARRVGAALALLASLPVLAVNAHAAAAEEVMKAGATIEIQNSTGKFDFLRIDAQRRRLLAAHENDGTWDVFDLNKGRLVTRLKVGGAVDTALDPTTGQYFVSVQEAQRVAVVDAKSLKEVKSIPMAGPTDAILFEPKNQRIYVTHDNGEHVWVIDPKAAKIVGAIDIPGAPEYMVCDAATNRIYLNIKTTDELVAIDPGSNKLVSRWPTAPAIKPHGLALDAQRQRLFVSGANGKLVAIDTMTGKITSSVDITEKVDQIAFDPGKHQIYCTGPDWMSVVDAASDQLKFIGNVRTAPTAKNVAVDPRTHAVWTTYTDGKSSYARSWLPK